MLCTCQTDTLCTKLASYGCIVRSICVCAYLKLCIFVAKVHKSLEVAGKFGSLCRNLAGKHLTGRAVQRNIVAFLICYALNLNGLGFIVNVYCTGTTDTALTHTTCNNCSVRSHTTSCRENTLGCAHSGEVFR